MTHSSAPSQARSRVSATLILALLLPLAAAHAQRVNLARYQPVTASSAASADPAVYATDGIVGNGNRWKSDGPGPHSLAVNLPFAMPVGSAHLYLGRDDIEAVASFVLQSWNGTTWVNIPGTAVTGTSNTVFNLVFPSPVTTAKIRLYSTEAVVRVREIALFPPRGPAGFPLGTDVTLNLAKKRAASATSTEEPSYPKGAVDGYVDDSARWKGDAVAGPHSLTLELEESSRVGSAHVYTGSASTAPISGFTLQYHDGTTWRDFPGGAVTGNTNPARRVRFTTPVATSRARLSMPGSGTTAMRVREVVLFAAQSGLPDDYPIGTDVITAPRPTTRYDRRADDYWRLVNRERSRALTADATGAGLARDDAPETSRHLQLLYNLDTDTYRLRRRESLHCLAARLAATNAGTAVVEQDDYQAMPHEVWRLEDLGTGYHRVINVWNGLALEADTGEPGRVTLQPPGTSTRQQWEIQWAGTAAKKGQGGYDTSTGRFRTGWYYNWDRVTGAAPPPDVTFCPMQHNRWWPGWDTLYQNRPGWLTSSKAAWMLGFNEPDHTDQANMTTDNAIALWPQLEQTDLPLASPVAANAFGGWLADFYNKANARGFRVDYTAVHWYANPNAASLISHLQSVKDTFGGRAVLLTEFSTVDWSGTSNWTEEDNYRFLAEFMWRAEAFSWIKRYALFIFSGNPPANPWTRGSGGVRGNFFASDGTTLTSFGELYAAWDGDTTIRDQRPYLLHNKSASHRLRRSSVSPAPSTGNIRRSDVSAQFALLPAATPGRWHVVSLRDGTRLRYAGTTLDFAPAGTDGPTTEWTYSVADGTWGYFYVDHPGTARRLKLVRTDDGSGAPTALTYSMAATSDTSDSVRWRFVVPYAPAETNPPAPPAGLTATSGIIRLAWPASTNLDALAYTVLRSSRPGGPYVRIASGITNTSHLDADVVATSNYYYVVTATDWLGHESAPSPEAAATAGYTATTTLIAAGTNWRYFDAATAPAGDWKAPGYPDATWPSGPGMLGFGDANGLVPSTVVASNRQWTTYFRRSFTVPDRDRVLKLEARLLRDDAAVIYLNGSEAWRDLNLPPGVITNSTPALAAINGTGESTWLADTLPPELLVNGTNILAVEVHQNALSSSDLAFDLALNAIVTVPADVALSWDRLDSGLMLSWPAEGAFLQLHSATNLQPPVIWRRVPGADPQFLGGRWNLPLPPAPGHPVFYRLQSPVPTP